ncbi:hypothetical protein [Bizionia myxarmorum]|uniref:Lipoprotein n=1 Tax=Bizionia myxarmorum TaxID=291186 RepID=A0A5D0RFW1_9FLAO|nr:hypothetical protein [Bizionia myxarmorum]TYB79695.1 hypothetical protein ES674_08070 [Bizionia myxarmorum]
MKKIIYALLCLMLIGCKTTDSTLTETLPINGFQKGVTTKKANSSLYINGFESAKIIHDKEGLAVSELQFHYTATTVETSKVMVNNFGVWKKRRPFYSEKHQAFVWENIQLLKNTSEKFTVITDGHEGDRILFSSIMVIDSENKDCLAKGHKLRDAIVMYFTEELKKEQSYDLMQKAYKEFDEESKTN